MPKSLGTTALRTEEGAPVPALALSDPVLTDSRSWGRELSGLEPKEQSSCELRRD